MTDAKWLKLIQKAADLAQAHREAIDVAEEEYERRYGHRPSDIDDDSWIDQVHYYGGTIDLDEIKKGADLSVSINKDKQR